MQIHLLLAFSIFALFLPRNAHSQNSTADGIFFDAENAVIEGYDKKNQIIKLSNSVKIIYEGQYIECDKASINTIKQIVNCTGNVRMISTQVKLQAEEINLNYKDNTGEIKNGFVQVGQVTFEGELIRKLSNSKYETLKGYYTACNSCPAFWSFKGSSVDAELGGYAYIKNATLYFGKVPTLWLPYIVLPLKSERQSGLLFPSFEISGSKGFTVEESLFWAMSESTDATFTAKYYTEKGLKGLFNYRYVTSEDSKGELNYGYLRDKSFAESDQIAQFNPDNRIMSRRFLRYNHMYVMPYNFIQRMEVNNVSDTRYPKDFKEDMPGRGDSALENTVSLTKNADDIHSSFDATYYQSLLMDDPFETNRDAVHRFPEVNLNIMPQSISNTNFLFEMGINYTNFARDNKSYDNRDVNGDSQAEDGEYNLATDLIRTGQRFDVEPIISYPIHFGTAASIIPSVSYRETRYQFPVKPDQKYLAQDDLNGEREFLYFSPSAYRRYLRTNIVGRVQFSRIFGDLNNPISNRYKHVFQPEASYSYIPYVDQPSHVFFGNDEFDANFRRDQPISDNDNIQFDYKDRIYERNLVTYAVVNKFLRKRFINGSPEYQQVLSHKLSQSYDIYEEKRETNLDKQRFSEITSLLDVRLDYLNANSTVKYYPYQGDTTQSTRFRFLNKREDFLEFTYSQDFLISNGTSIDLTSRTQDLKTGLGVNYKYFLFLGETTFDLISDEYQSYRFVTRLKPPGNCWALAFQLEKLVKTETDIKFGVNFIFDGQGDKSLKELAL